MNFLINLADDLFEGSRQFQFAPKALHPQMESIFTLLLHKDREDAESVLSIATCGFNQLMQMTEIPDEMADQMGQHRKAFGSCGVVNVSSMLMEEVDPEDPKTATLSDDQAFELQVYLGIYAKNVYGINKPLGVLLSPAPVHSTEYEGVRWYTYSFTFVIGVESEEWDKLYNLKMRELNWATALKNQELAQAEHESSALLNRMKH
jgi:hypothetical protein